MPDRPQSLEELALWAAHHQGEVDALWAAQHKHNDVTGKQLYTLDTRLSTLERKVARYAGFAAAAGGLFGALASRLIS